MKTRRILASCALLAALVTLPGTAHPAPVEPVRQGSAAAVDELIDEDVRVLAISVDGLNPAALRRVGPAGAPHLHRLFAEGAGTLNARSQVELTLTLPNHTSMVTGRRIDRRRGGHGVTWNTHRRGTTVQRAARHGVSSMFTVVHDGGGRTAMFATKTKFSLFARSWPHGIDRTRITDGDDRRVARAARNDLVRAGRALTFVHLGDVDRAGHARGFMSRAYLRAVRQVDRRIGLFLSAIDRNALDDVVVVLTADHGGRGRDHSDRRRTVNRRVPFVVWGAGIEPANLYDLNPGYRDPGRGTVGFGGTQPIRNGDLANLVTDLLGLGPVPDSLWNADQALSAAPQPSARG